ncbi:MAG: arylsulfatase [Isosphaeraceae bacterium]
MLSIIPRHRLAAWTVRVLGLAAGLAVAAPASLAADPAPRPNIVLLVADDLGWGDVGWHGSTIKTPHLDQLAARGARLEQFYVQPVCSPTRAALMTGRYPMRHGLQVGVVRPWAQYGLPLDEVMLPQELQRAGYETAITGKWHLGHFQPEYLPTRRGFDHQYGHYNGALDYNTHVRDGGFDWHRDDRENHDEGYSTHLLAREAVKRIEQRDRAKPLFLYVPFNAVHAPHQVPESYKKPYSALPEPRRTYAGMLAALDEAVGQIVAAIDEAGMRKQTLFVFTSDNGGPQPGVVTSNGPLRGAKATLYEGGVRVAAFATREGAIKPGTEVNVPLHAVDLLPTFARLAGVTPSRLAKLDGRDAWPAITEGAASPHDAILINTAPNAGAVRMGDWKLIVRGGGGSPNNDVAEPDAQPARRKAARARDTVELFNLAVDPYEKRNLAEAQPEKVAALRARYDAWAREAVPPRSAPKAPGFRVPRVWGQGD